MVNDERGMDLVKKAEKRILYRRRLTPHDPIDYSKRSLTDIHFSCDYCISDVLKNPTVKNPCTV
jgi:hypothetical protein